MQTQRLFFFYPADRRAQQLPGEAGAGEGEAAEGNWSENSISGYESRCKDLLRCGMRYFCADGWRDRDQSAEEGAGAEGAPDAGLLEAVCAQEVTKFFSSVDHFKMLSAKEFFFLDGMEMQVSEAPHSSQGAEVPQQADDEAQSEDSIIAAASEADQRCIFFFFHWPLRTRLSHKTR